MSLNVAKKRLQRDIAKYPKALQDVHHARANKYALPTTETTHWPVPKHERKTELADIGLANGDLAYITKGPKKGTISRVFQYLPELDCVLLADVTVKRIMQKLFWMDEQKSHLVDIPDYVPRKDIRVAARDRDADGKVYYVVAEELELGEKYYDERYKEWLPKRFIKHHKTIEIPWPNPPAEPEDDYFSTKESTVLAKTYELQSLATPPIPEAALSQLRNPYSRHKKRVLSEFEARKLNAPAMPLSPEQKIYLAKAAAQPPKTYQPLSDEIKAFIGQRISSHMEKIDSPAMLAHLKALTNLKIPEDPRIQEQK